MVDDDHADVENVQEWIGRLDTFVSSLGVPLGVVDFGSAWVHAW